MYGIIITVATGIYVVKGGMFGVVVTDILQYILMTISAIIIAVVAMDKVSPAMLNTAVVQAGKIFYSDGI